MTKPGLEMISLSAGDWGMVILYILVNAGIAVWTKLRQRNTTVDYFLAGRSMNWIVVAVAVFATLFSTISFVATPGEAYSNGIMYALVLPGQLLVAPLAIWLFLRFFFHTPTFSAYEYLEKRYNVACRMLGACLFIIVRMVYAGVVFYSASVIFESLVGWPPMITILVIGIFTIAYTTTGGMKAVIFSDVMQTVVMFLGIGVILWKLLQSAGFDLAAIYNYTAAQDKGFGMLARPEFYHLNFHSRISFWALMNIIIITPLMTLSCDQLVIQRLLTSKDYAGAKRSVYGNYLVSMPVVGMLWLIGISLLYFYGTGRAELPEGIKGDQVLGYFINTQIPPPIPGLIVAALLAALMSTIAAVVNSVATVVFRDVLSHVKGIDWGGKKEIVWCWWLSIASGVASLLIALFMAMAGKNIQSNVLETVNIWGGLWGILLVGFLYGVLSRRVSGPAIFIAMLAGGILNLSLPYLWYYRIPAAERISFLWIGVPGLVIALVLAPLLSLIWPNKKDLTQLTLYTLRK